jgi:hypothetical protein
MTRKILTHGVRVSSLLFMNPNILDSDEAIWTFSKLPTVTVARQRQFSVRPLSGGGKVLVLPSRPTSAGRPGRLFVRGWAGEASEVEEAAEGGARGEISGEIGGGRGTFFTVSWEEDAAVLKTGLQDRGDTARGRIWSRRRFMPSLISPRIALIESQHTDHAEK